MDHPAAVLGLAYLASQLFFTLSLNEARGGSGPLPFSCSPMFAMPQHLLRDDMVNWFTDIDADLRAPGHLGTIEWSGPAMVSHELSEADLRRLPWTVSYMGSVACRFPRVQACLQGWTKTRSRGCRLFYTNNPSLRGSIRAVIR